MNDQTRAFIVKCAMTAISILALICVTSLCLTLFYKNYADPAVLTAIISIASTLVGALGGSIAFRPSASQPQNGNIPPPPPNLPPP